MAAKRGRGRPRYEPTQEKRDLVKLAATIGIPHHDIARLIKTGIRQLLTHYRDELDLAKTEATMKIGGALYNSAMKGNTAAQIFWMKAQAGWREKHVVALANEDGKPLQHAVAAAIANYEDAMKTYMAMITGQR